MAKQIAQERKCKSAWEFIQQILGMSVVDGPFLSGLHRGHGDAKYRLTPSILREDADSTKRLERYARTLGEDFRVSDSTTLIRVEFAILSDFYNFADRAGLVLPNVTQDLHDLLVMRHIREDGGGYYADEDSWPRSELRPILALAQHYGLPTRLLDWSLDPFVATYFAARDGAKRLRDGNKGGAIALWSIKYPTWKLLQEESFRTWVSLATAPGGGNPNLAAQRGIFTLVIGGHGPGTIDREPIDNVIRAEFTRLDLWSQETVRNTAPLLKTTLPVSEAPALLKQLYALGYDAGRIFPGFQGAAQSVEDLTLFANVPAWKLTT